MVMQIAFDHSILSTGECIVSNKLTTPVLNVTGNTTIGGKLMVNESIINAKIIDIETRLAALESNSISKDSLTNTIMHLFVDYVQTNKTLTNYSEFCKLVEPKQVVDLSDDERSLIIAKAEA